MTVWIKAYPKGMKRGEQLEFIGTEASIGWNMPFALFTFNHVGTGVSIREIMDMGLTEDDLKAASEEPQEFGIKLFKLKEAEDEQE